MLHLEVLEDRWVPSTATGMNAGDIAGNIQSQSYLLNTPAMTSTPSQPPASPQILSSNVGRQADPITVNWTPSGSALPDATQYVSYSTTISAAPSSGSSTLSVGIDPASADLLKSIGLTAVVTPGGEGTPGTVTIQGIPTASGDFNVTVVAYREPTEPLDTKTYTLSIAPGSAIASQITATVSPNSVNAGSSVNVTANVTNVSDGTPITAGGTVTFTLSGASGTTLISSPAAVNTTTGVATATLTIPSTEPSGGFNLTANYSGVSGSVAPASTTINSALTVNNTGVSILGSITPTTLTASTADQSVTASATVKDNNNPVVGGTVTFNLLNSSGTQVTGATATGVTDSTGLATASLPVPANTAAGTYTVTASYTDSNSVVHTATVGTLVINAVEAAASVTLNPIAPITVSASDQVVNLSATVTQSGGQGNLGSVQFQVLSGATVINSATAAVGSNGVATAAVTIPGGTPVGTYQVLATFTGRGETTATATGTLTVSAASTAVTAGNATANFSSGSQTTSINVGVTSPGGTVNSGTVTVMLNGTSIGTGNVSNNSATVTLTIPAGLAAGNYSLVENYAGSANFSPSTAIGTLTINPVPVNPLPPSPSPPSSAMDAAVHIAIDTAGILLQGEPAALASLLAVSQFWYHITPPAGYVALLQDLLFYLPYGDGLVGPAINAGTTFANDALAMFK